MREWAWRAQFFPTHISRFSTDNALLREVATSLFVPFQKQATPSTYDKTWIIVLIKIYNVTALYQEAEKSCVEGDCV